MYSLDGDTHGETHCTVILKWCFSTCSLIKWRIRPRHTEKTAEYQTLRNVKFISQWIYDGKHDVPIHTGHNPRSSRPAVFPGFWIKYYWRRKKETTEKKLLPACAQAVRGKVSAIWTVRVRFFVLPKHSTSFRKTANNIITRMCRVAQ